MSEMREPDPGPLGHVGDFQPPLGGHAPPLQCNRLLSGAFDSPTPDYCGKPATSHIFWTTDGENGLACPEHAQEARDRWVFWAMHDYEMACSIRGARFIFDLNRCVVDDDDLGLTAGNTVEQELSVDA